jgi:hypothetical protein
MPEFGRGPLLTGWMTIRERCPECGLVYERSAGDTWAFWIIGDRIPIAIAIAAALRRSTPDTGSVGDGVVTIGLIATISQPRTGDRTRLFESAILA